VVARLQSMSKVLSSVLGFVLLGVLAYLAYLGLQWGYQTLQAGGKPADALNVLLLAALGGLGYLYRSSREQRQQLESRLAESKRQLYDDYVALLREMTSEIQAGKTLDPSKFLPRLREFSFRSVLLGSDAVVQAQIRVTNIERIGVDGNNFMLPAIGDVLLALRKDIGFPATKLTNQTILGVFVKDIDSQTELFRSWSHARDQWDKRVGWTRNAIR